MKAARTLPSVRGFVFLRTAVSTPVAVRPKQCSNCIYTTYNIHTHHRLTALCPGLPRLAGSRKVKPVWILLTQETVSGSGISWAAGPYASLHLAPDRQPLQHPTTQCFAGSVPFLPPNQQHQRTDGSDIEHTNATTTTTPV